jgi:hypothetical protein
VIRQLFGQQQYVGEFAGLNLGIESTIDMNGESHRTHQSTHDIEGWFAATPLVGADDRRRNTHPTGDLDLCETRSHSEILEQLARFHEPILLV